jgi:hypothetical protein
MPSGGMQSRVISGRGFCVRHETPSLNGCKGVVYARFIDHNRHYEMNNIHVIDDLDMTSCFDTLSMNILWYGAGSTPDFPLAAGAGIHRQPVFIPGLTDSF